jgi:HSP20 family protein
MTLWPVSYTFDPIHAFSRVRRDFDRLFETPLNWSAISASPRLFPAMNVFGDRDGYVIRAEVPGLNPENLTIEAQERTLTIGGKREVREMAEGRFVRRERRTGEFSRSLELPEDAALDKAEAACRNGVLTVRIPKREEAKPRRVPIEAGDA